MPKTSYCNEANQINPSAILSAYLQSRYQSDWGEGEMGKGWSWNILISEHIQKSFQPWERNRPCKVHPWTNNQMAGNPEKCCLPLCDLKTVIQFLENILACKVPLYLEGDKIWVIWVFHYGTSWSNITYILEKKNAIPSGKHPARHLVCAIYCGLCHGALALYRAKGYGFISHSRTFHIKDIEV